MNKEFEELCNIIRIDREKSPWMQKVTLPEWISLLEGEIEEVKMALKNNDQKNLHEELGDVFLVSLTSLVIAEDTHQANASKIISDASEKLKRRKPWIFTGENLSIEEEEQQWKLIKQNERNRS